MLKNRATLLVAGGLAVAGLVLGTAAPALAYTNAWVGPCGGTTWPTVSYKDTGGYSEVYWRDGPGGNFLKAAAQYSPNVAVYNTSPRRTPASYNQVGYTGPFAYFTRTCI